MSDLDALLNERRGYVARNLTERIAAVDAQLALLGHKPARVERATEAAPEAAIADVAKRAPGRPRKSEA